MKNVTGKNGGARPGAGRPPGRKSKKTLERKIIEAGMKQRIMESVDVLLSSQMNLAKGCQMLFKLNKKDKKPELVTDQKEIEKYLTGGFEKVKDTRYFITTKIPDNKAIDSMLDRAFGKARQNIGLDGGEDGKPVSITMTGAINKIYGKEVKK